LVYSIKCKNRLQVHKALQFCGDTFLREQDEDTAITLFTVALAGFTYMDVHQSRAECMLKLGDISNSHGDLLKAVEQWTTARPLFERSSQGKEVQGVDERLACVSREVLERYRENMARLVQLNGSSSNPCPIEDVTRKLKHYGLFGKLYIPFQQPVHIYISTTRIWCNPTIVVRGNIYQILQLRLIDEVHNLIFFGSFLWISKFNHRVVNRQHEISCHHFLQLQINLTGMA
jgi:hypothetical protein